MLKVKTTIIAILGTALSGHAFALEDTLQNREEQATRYEKVYDLDDMMNQTIKAMMPVMGQSQGASAADLKKQSYVTNVLLTDVMSKEWMSGAMHRAMVKTFTADELKAMADFYSTPEGQSTLKKMPQMMASFTPEMQNRMREKMPAAIQKIQKYMAENP